MIYRETHAITENRMSGLEFLKKTATSPISVDEAKGIVECYAAAIGNKDSVNDIILPGAFDASLRGRTPRVVWGHDWNQPIGKVIDIREVPAGDSSLPPAMKANGVGGLYVKFQLNLKSQRGREAFADLAFFGQDHEFSIGYKTIEQTYDRGRQANLLKTLELYEISPVLHGANRLTGLLSIKDASEPPAGQPNAMDLASLRDLIEGLDAGSELDLPTLTALQALISAIDPDHDGDVDLPGFEDPDDDDADDAPGATDDDSDETDTPTAEQLAMVMHIISGFGDPGATDRTSTDAGLSGYDETEDAPKDAQTDIDVKVGRVLSAANMRKLAEVCQMITDILKSAGYEAPMNQKKSIVFENVDDAFGFATFLNPLVKRYAAELAWSDFGDVSVKCENITDEMISAFDDAAEAWVLAEA